MPTKQRLPYELFPNLKNDQRQWLNPHSNKDHRDEGETYAILRYIGVMSLLPLRTLSASSLAYLSIVLHLWPQNTNDQPQVVITYPCVPSSTEKPEHPYALNHSPPFSGTPSRFHISLA
jgi:hypothetical protein